MRQTPFAKQTARVIHAIPGHSVLALVAALALSPCLAQDAPLPNLYFAQELGSTPIAETQLPEPSTEHTAPALRMSPQIVSTPLTQTPASSPVQSLFRFAYWFSVLLLASLSARDSLKWLLQLLWRTTPQRATAPFAQWPRLSLVLEDDGSGRLVQSLSDIRQLDYPADRLGIIVLCAHPDAGLQTALAETLEQMPGQIIALAPGPEAERSQRCLAAGLRHGNGDIVMAIPPGAPLGRLALKAVAEAFFDPSLGALLGYLPGAPEGDRGLAARLSTLLRLAARKFGIQPSPGLLPGTGVLALRRHSLHSAGIDPSIPHGSLACLHEQEQAGWRFALHTEQLAAGEPMQDWQSRARWLRQRADASRATRQSRSGWQHLFSSNAPGQFLTALWLLVALAALWRFFAGDVFAAAIGLALCTATAFGIEGRPATLFGPAMLLRANGRHASTRLLSLAPVVFLHDLCVMLSHGLRGLLRLRRPSSRHARPLTGETRPLH